MQLGGLTRSGTWKCRMSRRIALALIGGFAAVSRAQPSRKAAYVGFLAPPVADHFSIRLFEGFRSEMEKLGWTEGRRVRYERRFPGEAATRDQASARLAMMAKELVESKVDVIVAVNTRSAVAAKSATTTIPIVFMAAQPVENGLVASFARPGGNATGVTYYDTSLIAKRLQLLMQAVPGIKRIAFLGFEDELYRAGQVAAKALNVELILARADRADQIERAFTEASQADAWIVEGHQTLTPKMHLIIDLIAKSRKPAIYGQEEYPEAGGLMSYTDDRDHFNVDLARLVDRVLRGAKPADLPVIEPARFRLIINRKTARAQGITIAPSVMLQADQVLE